jgi:hypothetical protein
MILGGSPLLGDLRVVGFPWCGCDVDVMWM